MPVKESIISAASLLIVAVLAGCSASSPADGSPPAAGSPPATPVPSSHPPFAFRVVGVHPVPPNGSQDTHAQTPEAECDSATFAADQALGVRVTNGFTLARFPAAATVV